MGIFEVIGIVLFVSAIVAIFLIQKELREGAIPRLNDKADQK